MSGTVCVVTGATSGIGLEAARILAQRSAGGALAGTTGAPSEDGVLIAVGRDRERCEKTREELAASAPGTRVCCEVADLSCLAAVRAVAARIAGAVDHVDVLVNNAGTFTFRRQCTPDGLETQLAVNWLAAFVLTGLLLPRLSAARRARVVTVSSGSHFAGRMHWSDLQLRRGYNGLKAYDQSKLATVLFTRELARRLGLRSTVSTYAVDPGLVKTGIGAKGGGSIVRAIWKARTRKGIPACRAAESVCWCALDEAAAGKSGLYWKERAALPPSSRAMDPLAAVKLWEAGEALSGLSYP
jgi:NAD(P)-dependent dehydrogenase (short-subunit alcohol dehydrogenase family)